MASKKKSVFIANSVTANPVLPFQEINIEGITYKMCFDFGALADAETRMIAKGIDVNLNFCLPRLNFANTRILFAASLMAYHPEIDPVVAMGWVSPHNNLEILNAILDAWKQSVPGAKSGPRKPDQ